MNDKMQMNVYVPEDINEYVEKLRQETHLSKSEIVTMALLYTKEFWTPENFTKMATKLRLGLGLEKVA
jgi:hypothetical protein